MRLNHNEQITREGDFYVVVLRIGGSPMHFEECEERAKQGFIVVSNVMLGDAWEYTFLKASSIPEMGKS